MNFFCHQLACVHCCLCHFTGLQTRKLSDLQNPSIFLMELQSGANDQHIISSSGFLERYKVGKKNITHDATYYKLNSSLDWLLWKAAELVKQTWILNLSTYLNWSILLGESFISTHSSLLLWIILQWRSRYCIISFTNLEQRWEGQHAFSPFLFLLPSHKLPTAS